MNNNLVSIRSTKIAKAQLSGIFSLNFLQSSWRRSWQSVSFFIDFFLNTISTQFVADGVFKAELNEFLTRELAEDGYSGVEVRVTPIRTEIIILATRTQNVLGEKGRRIRELTSVVQKRFGFPEGTVEVIITLDLQMFILKVADKIPLMDCNARRWIIGCPGRLHQV